MVGGMINFAEEYNRIPEVANIFRIKATVLSTVCNITTDPVAS